MSVVATCKISFSWFAGVGNNQGDLSVVGMLVEPLRFFKSECWGLDGGIPAVGCVERGRVDIFDSGEQDLRWG